MRKLIHGFVLALALMALQPSWASEIYSLPAGNSTEQQATTAADACPAPQAAVDDSDDPAPQNVIEYRAGG